MSVQESAFYEDKWLFHAQICNRNIIYKRSQRVFLGNLSEDV